MYNIKDFDIDQKCSQNNTISPFMKLMKSTWDKTLSEPEVFRYAINNLQKRLIEEKYIILLNTDRGSKRRTPEDISNIRQPFDDTKFNFTKVSQKETMFSIYHDNEEYTLLVNVSPINKYHTLLCPSLNKKMPQVVTAPSLSLALEIMFSAQDNNLKIVYNSMCAFASVNHLHYHLVIEEHTLPIQHAKWKQIKNNINIIKDHPAPAFCFEVTKSSLHTQVQEIFKLIQYLLDKSIAHNILLAMKGQNVGVYLWPRKSSSGVKQTVDFNVAALELSGWITVYSAEAFKTLQKDDIEKELTKWKIDNFDALCKEVELLF